MAVNLKELSHKEDLLTGGHRLCAGCGAPIVFRQILLAADKPVIVTNATGCLEVATTIFPYTAWKVPWMHSAFENSAATCAGIEAAYQSLKRQGRYDEDVYFMAIGGDGGTYDIGLQALSGALERRHQMVYVCYDNQAYMNTGIQRSGATPLGAETTTTPCGSARPGKTERRKNLTEICAAHGISYVAQTTIANWRDVVKCAEKAFHAEGPAFLNILAPCPRGWRHESDETIDIAKLSRDALVWPCYEIEDGKYKISYKPKQPKPISEWFSSQARFRHMLRPENQALLETAQAEVDQEWKRLLRLEAMSQEDESE